MAPDQWSEYLEAACDHLRRTRLAVEAGHPARRDRLALPGLRRTSSWAASSFSRPGYDQLALEVSTRMSEMKRYRRNHVPTAPPASHFVDQRV